MIISLATYLYASIINSRELDTDLKFGLAGVGIFIAATLLTNFWV